jgi:hypothetical protein
MAIFILLLPTFSAFAQVDKDAKKKKIVCTANLLTYDATVNNDVKLLIGNVQFEHEGAVCYSDTAYFNEIANTIDAYGQNLVIHINDSVSLYGKHLQYNGNTREAIIDKEVRLTNQTAVLYSEQLHYNRLTNVAYYNTGGRIESGQSVLTSKEAWFYTNYNEVYFRDSVVLTTPQYEINSDTLKYNTSTEMAYFLGPTLIYSDSNNMYCEYGWYDTRTDICEFQKESRLYNRSQCLLADTIWYDKINEIGIARSSVLIIDSVENILFLSNYAEYQAKQGNAYLTDSAVAILIEDNDSLFIHGDALYVLFDSAQNLTFMQAYHHVKFFRTNLQGSCDSLVYVAVDSIISLISSPVLWSEENQFLADTIHLFLRNKQLSEIHFSNNASVFADVFEEQKFNQIKGDYMIAYFADSTIQTVFVDGSAECLYYIQEDNKDLIGIQKSTSAQMCIFFEENEVKEIRFYENVKGKVYPEDKLDAPLLNGFIWLDSFRPKSKQAIFDPIIYTGPLPKEQE